MTALDLMIANGTLLSLTPQNNPHLWKAAMVRVTSALRLTPLTEAPHACSKMGVSKAVAFDRSSLLFGPVLTYHQW